MMMTQGKPEQMPGWTLELRWKEMLPHLIRCNMRAGQFRCVETFRESTGVCFIPD